MSVLEPCREDPCGLGFSTRLKVVKGKGRVLCRRAPDTAVVAEGAGSEPDCPGSDPDLTACCWGLELLILPQVLYLPSRDKKRAHLMWLSRGLIELVQVNSIAQRLACSTCSINSACYLFDFGGGLFVFFQKAQGVAWPWKKRSWDIWEQGYFIRVSAFSET